LIREGRLGKVRMVRGTSLFTDYETEKQWAMSPENGGALLDMGVHNFDIIRNLVGSEPKKVFSTVKSFSNYPLSDLSAMTQILFDNGAIGQQWTSFELPQPSLPDSLHRYVVVGEKAILDVDGYGKLQLGTGEKWETVWVQPPIDYVNKPLDPVRLEAFYTQTQAFADDVLDKRKPLVSGEEGRVAIEMVEAARISSSSGNAVDLPLSRGG
jgi:predicted dehydrogenase